MQEKFPGPGTLHLMAARPRGRGTKLAGSHLFSLIVYLTRRKKLGPSRSDSSTLEQITCLWPQENCRFPTIGQFSRRRTKQTNPSSWNSPVTNWTYIELPSSELIKCRIRRA